MHVPFRFKIDTCFCKYAIECNWRVFYYMPSIMQKNEDLCKYAITKNKDLLEIMNSEMRINLLMRNTIA
jgi:hypothetical protein